MKKTKLRFIFRSDKSFRYGRSMFITKNSKQLQYTWCKSKMVYYLNTNRPTMIANGLMSHEN